MRFRIVQEPSRRGDVYRGPDGRWRVYPSGRIVEVPPVDPADKPVGLPGRDGERGADGRPGVDGRDGQGFTFRGPWRRKGRYSVNDVVYHEGGSWVALIPEPKNAPSDQSKQWGRMSAPGEDGVDREFYTRVVKRVETVGGGGGDVTPIAAIFDSPSLKGFAVYVPSNGHADNARADDFATSGVVGICAGDVEAGSAGVLQTEGQITRDDWTAVAGVASLTPGVVYYLSPTTAGQITSTAPTAAGQSVVVIGRATCVDTLDIELSPPILLSEVPEE